MYKDLIREKGISITQQRINLLGTLDTLNKPVTIDELEQHLESNMNTSTLYRSLKIFVDHGLVYQTDFREGVAYFEFHGTDHHHHIICTLCKDRTSIDLCMNSQFSELEKETGYTISNHIFEVFGLCKNCTSS